MPRIDRNRVNIPPLEDRRRQLRQDATPTEKRLWRCLQRRQLLGKKFRRQYSLGSYVVDFFCPECMLAIELDGQHHYEIWRHDHEAQRTQFIEGLGVRILRFENRALLENLDGVLETIRQAVRESLVAS